MFLFFVFLFVFILGVVAVFLWLKERKRKHLIELLHLKLFLIRLSKQSKENRDLKKEVELSEQLFSALGSFKQTFVFEIAVPYVGEEIHFYAALPARFSEVLERQIHSLWPDAQVESIEDYNIFNYSGEISGAWVSEEEDFVIPIRTYNEFGSDTFSQILGGLSKVNKLGEGCAVQFLVRRANPALKKTIQTQLLKIKKGEKLKKDFSKEIKKSFSSAFGFSFSDVFYNLLTGFSNNESKNKKEEEKIIDEGLVKGIESKISKPFFEVNVRILSSAPNKEQSEAILDGIIAGFSQFSAPERNEFKIIKSKNPSLIASKYSYREFDEKQKMILNSEELASIFHFPTPFTEIPRIKELKFKEVPPPSFIPKEGICIGESRYRGERRDIKLLKEDRRRHLYLVGQTGTGKSLSLNSFSGQDIENGEGVCVIDPNGDLFEDVLSRVPKHRIDDVMVFDPSDLSRPLGLNMLEYDPNFPEQKTFIINEMMMIFDTLYDLKTTGGPMFEQYARNSLLLLMDDPSNGFTILEIPRVLSDSEFRKKLLSKCKNIIARDFWEKEAEKAGGEASLANIVPYITSKFNTFIANDYVRPIIAQSKSTLNFREIIDGGKVLLVNLSKGRIGDLNASLLGMIIVGKLTIAAFSRADIQMDERKDFYLYIDEFQNFTTPSIATILSEARKYRLNLIIAHQFIGQLSEKIKDSVFGNVGSMIVFRVGADDAEYLVKQFEPTFDRNNLLNIENLNAHAKLLLNNQITTPFNIFVKFPPKGNSEISKAVKEYSRLKYGRPRDVVESEIYERLKGI